MPKYRIYVIGSDGHFVDSIPLECAADVEATEQAERLVDGHDVELWQRARKIARFEQKPKIQFGVNAMTEKSDRKEPERLLELAHRMAAGADPLTKERLEKLIRV